MPEEINRVIADHLSSLLLCPSDTAVANLKNEGIQNGVINVGDIMMDAAKKANKIVSSVEVFTKNRGLIFLLKLTY